MMSKNIYFASDFHLGIDASMPSSQREILIVDWLSEIEDSAEEIYLLGDIFDYWFDYKEVVPKGYTLLLGKLKYLRFKGIPIYFFTGNHDMWMFDYFEKELDIPTYRNPLIKNIKGKKFYLAHGDGLGEVKFRDKLMKKTFANPVLQWLFARIHPNTGLSVMRYFSRLSRSSHGDYENNFDHDNEFLLHYSEVQLKHFHDIDYFVFGHRHIPIKLMLSNSKTEFINLGDWISHFTYGVFDGNIFKLEYYQKSNLQ
jgi:UDP-2,3-diacylglucosamine hydrolase